jgi:nitroreductase
MRTLLFKNVVVFFLMEFLSLGLVLAEPGDIFLPAPATRFNVDLKEALQLRRTTRSFQSADIPLEVLSNLLWSANGVNRPDGKRTAPSAYNTQCIKIYLANGQGVFCYDSQNHFLKQVIKRNIKSVIAPANPYAAVAPVILLLVADLSGFPAEENRASQINLAHASSGFVGQNIYLAAAAFKLGTTYAAGLDVAIVKKELNLTGNEIPLALMPLGYPALSSQPSK